VVSLVLMPLVAVGMAPLGDRLPQIGREEAAQDGHHAATGRSLS
jgi:hypothetical protein